MNASLPRSTRTALRAPHIRHQKRCRRPWRPSMAPPLKATPLRWMFGKRRPLSQPRLRAVEFAGPPGGPWGSLSYWSSVLAAEKAKSDLLSFTFACICRPFHFWSMWFLFISKRQQMTEDRSRFSLALELLSPQRFAQAKDAVQLTKQVPVTVEEAKGGPGFTMFH